MYAMSKEIWKLSKDVDKIDSNFFTKMIKIHVITDIYVKNNRVHSIKIFFEINQMHS